MSGVPSSTGVKFLFVWRWPLPPRRPGPASRPAPLRSREEQRGTGTLLARLAEAHPGVGTVFECPLGAPGVPGQGTPDGSDGRSGRERAAQGRQELRGFDA